MACLSPGRKDAAPLGTRCRYARTAAKKRRLPTITNATPLPERHCGLIPSVYTSSYARGTARNRRKAGLTRRYQNEEKLTDMLDADSV
jgi:hypothetical protein